MTNIQINRDEIHFAASATIHLARAIRLPAGGLIQHHDDDFPFGMLPIHRLSDYADRLPIPWRNRTGVFVPLDQCEALEISITGRWWKPNAVKIGFGKTNVMTGTPWSIPLSDNPRDYLACPPVCRINGGLIRPNCRSQFTAPPEQNDNLTTNSPIGYNQLHICVFEPRSGLFNDLPNPDFAWLAEEETGKAYNWPTDGHIETGDDSLSATLPPPCAEMWELASVMQINIYLVNYRLYRRITGHNAPPSPITQHNRAAVGLPWSKDY